MLAAGESTRLAAAELVHDRKQLVGGSERVVPLAVPAARQPEAQVFLDGQLGEDAPPLGHERHAGTGDVLRPATDE